MTPDAAPISDSGVTFIRAGRIRELLKLTRRVWEAREEHGADVSSETVGAVAQLIGASAGIFVRDAHFVRGGKGPMESAAPFQVDALLPAVSAIIENRTSCRCSAR